MLDWRCLAAKPDRFSGSAPEPSATLRQSEMAAEFARVAVAASVTAASDLCDMLEVDDEIGVGHERPIP